MALMMDNKPTEYKGEALVWEKLSSLLPNDVVVYNHREVVDDKFNDLTLAEKRKFLPENLKEASYKKEVNIWCQWCAVREKCLESYKSLIET